MQSPCLETPSSSTTILCLSLYRRHWLLVNQKAAAPLFVYGPFVRKLSPYSHSLQHTRAHKHSLHNACAMPACRVKAHKFTTANIVILFREGMDLFDYSSAKVCNEVELMRVIAEKRWLWLTQANIERTKEHEPFLPRNYRWEIIRVVAVLRV